MRIRRARAYGKEWKRFNSVCLAISVGKEQHEGVNLAAAVDMINHMNKPCLLRMSDTLQRHNIISNNISSETAYNLALSRGDDWLKRNAATLAQLRQETTILRWNDIIRDPEFVETHKAFSHLASKNMGFMAAVQSDIEKFMARRKHLTEKEAALYRAHSFMFIIEEIAGQSLMSRKYPHANLYPGKNLESISYVRAGELNGAPWGLHENTCFTRFALFTKEWETIPEENRLQIVA